MVLAKGVSYDKYTVMMMENIKTCSSGMKHSKIKVHAFSTAIKIIADMLETTKFTRHKLASMLTSLVKKYYRPLIELLALLATLISERFVDG